MEDTPNGTAAPRSRRPPESFWLSLGLLALGLVFLWGSLSLHGVSVVELLALLGWPLTLAGVAGALFGLLRPRA